MQAQGWVLQSHVEELFAWAGQLVLSQLWEKEADSGWTFQAQIPDDDSWSN